jgi:hypothetical protein
MNAHNGNITHAARDLGITREYMSRLVNGLGTDDFAYVLAIREMHAHGMLEHGNGKA